MKVRKVITGFVGLVVAAILAMLFWPSKGTSKATPPKLILLSVEPAGIIDDNGAELSLVKFAVRNPDPGNIPNLTTLNVKDSGSPIEVKAKNGWTIVEGTSQTIGDYDFRSRPISERFLLVPEGAESCRFRLKYASTVLTFNGYLLRSIERLPLGIRRKVPITLWYSRRYKPSSNWQEITLELPLPSKAAPASRSAL